MIILKIVDQTCDFWQRERILLRIANQKAQINLNTCINYCIVFISLSSSLRSSNLNFQSVSLYTQNHLKVLVFWRSRSVFRNNLTLGIHLSGAAKESLDLVLEYGTRLCRIYVGYVVSIYQLRSKLQYCEVGVIVSHQREAYITIWGSGRLSLIDLCGNTRMPFK